MKRKAFTFVFLFCLLIVSCPFSGHAAGPDGFANVPWGASRSQVDQAMAQQGFRFTSQRNNDGGSISIIYQGALVGTAGDLTFVFLNGTFFSGYFDFHREDGGDAEQNAYMQFSPMIQSKYGSPTTSGSVNPGGSYKMWDGLQAPGSSDTIRILLRYSAAPRACGGNFCSSYFNVLYTNQSLEQRLAGQNKNGL
jgi:hypothetical protein